jgi:threonylcarbamoyladenosine tRNA methylthiotransferase MtaB
MKTCAFATFGCKTNQYETQAIREQVLARGLKEVPRNSFSDLYVINTCVVTEEALKKSVRCIQRALRLNPSAKVVVTGCLVNYNRGALEVLGDKVILLPNSEKQNVANLLFPQTADSKITPSLSVSGNAGHTRAFLKIQDGCDAFCSYCVVPFVRGAPRSRDEKDVLREAERLSNAGYGELVLTGINIGLYGREQKNGEGLSSLLRKLANLRLFTRIRLSDVEVTEVTDSLLSVMRAYAEICPHLHIPLQSGSDRILTKMNRKYTAEDYLKVVERVLSVLGETAITTDVIVGFPGESEADFEQTLRICQETGFARMHIFPFSPRAGTVASALPRTLSAAQEARRRCRLLASIADNLALAFKKKFIGRKVRVLVESEGAKTCSGYSDHYLVTEFSGTNGLRGQVAEVDVSGATAQKLTGAFVRRLVRCAERRAQLE